VSLLKSSSSNLFSSHKPTSSKTSQDKEDNKCPYPCRRCIISDIFSRHHLNLPSSQTLVFRRGHSASRHTSPKTFYHPSTHRVILSSFRKPATMSKNPKNTRKATPEDQIRFLISCCKHSNFGRVSADLDYRLIGSCWTDSIRLTTWL
jgi:hypothetical protein